MSKTPKFFLKNSMFEMLSVDYKAYIALGFSDEEAQNHIIESYSKMTELVWRKIKFNIDPKYFWVYLAYVEWTVGRLNSDTLDKSIAIIDKESINETLNDRKCLLETKELIMSKQPVKKLIKKIPVFKSFWKVGDLLAMRIIRLDDNVDEWFEGKYVLIRLILIRRHKVYRMDDNYCDERMVFALYDWVGDEIPDPNIVDTLEFITFAKYVDPLLGKYDETCFDYWLSKRDLMKREIIVLGHDKEFQSKLPDSFELRYNRVPSINPYLIDSFLTRSLRKHIKK